MGGFASQGEALQALRVALERLNRRNGRLGQMTLSELAEEYLAQHEAEPRTIAKLRWLLRRRPVLPGPAAVRLLAADPVARRATRADVWADVGPTRVPPREAVTFVSRADCASGWF